MRAIDYLSVFFLLGAAPAWQAGLDDLSAGLGSALLVLLLIGAIRATLSEIPLIDQVQRSSDRTVPTQKQR